MRTFLFILVVALTVTCVALAFNTHKGGNLYTQDAKTFTPGTLETGDDYSYDTGVVK